MLFATGLPLPARITAISTENARTKTLVFDLRWRAEPGQFMLAWLPRFDEKPFSLVDDDPVTITVAAVGPFTRLLHQLAVGDAVWLRGPLGRGFELQGQRLLAVGGGYGAAPLSFLARRAVASGRAMTVALGAKNAEELILTAHLTEAGADVRVTTEDGSAGQRGLVTDAVGPMLASGDWDGLFACGPDGMLRTLAELARAYRVPAQLSWEAYMRCGIGLCGSCERHGRLLCVEGPVAP